MKTNQTAIGMLRQWLNEDRIDDPKKMVTNEQIEMWLALDPLKEEEGECRIKSCTGDSECLEHCPCDCHQEKETEKFCTQVGCKAWGDHAHGKVEVKKETEKETPKKLPSEVCYCGHPEERHSGVYSNAGRGDTWLRDECNHCTCKRFYLDETAKEKTVGCNECGNNINL